MKVLVLITAVLVLGLSGCADMKTHWDNLDGSEKIAISVSTAILVGAAIVANGSGDTVNVGGNGCHKHGNPPSRWDCPEL